MQTMRRRAFLKIPRGAVLRQTLTNLALIGGAVFAWTAAADEKFAQLTIGNDIYTNVTVTKVTATDIFFFHAGGMGNAKIKSLSPDLQEHFHPASQQAQEAAQYRQAVARAAAPPPASPRPETATRTVAEAAVWRMDFDGALKQAQSEKKLVLLDFTGSDWCPWCIKFDQEVLSTSKFAAYADKKLELVKVDFPRQSTQSTEQRHANSALKDKFQVEGFPTYVLLAADGRELGRQVGYQQGGADAFIAELERFAAR
jgi:protein disulfide-isomerase